jgi:nucleotide-binding universal stress UspA family protein
MVYEHRITRGLVADAILHTARQTGASQIVMRGRRRRILPTLFGGVHDAVLRNAPCPVTVLRSEMSAAFEEPAYQFAPRPGINVA